MPISSYKNKLKKELSNFTDTLANQISETIKNINIKIFFEKSLSFKNFIDEAITGKYSSGDTEYPEAKLYYYNTTKREFISKESIFIEIHKKYLTICSTFCKISFEEFNISPLKTKKALFVLQELLCEELQKKFDSEIIHYIKKKYNHADTNNEENFKTLCTPYINYSYPKLKIPSIQISFVFTDHLSEETKTLNNLTIN